jgi:ElaB/YqjD/DUF883 family membrane-anchored ribosome-binding protein
MTTTRDTDTTTNSGTGDDSGGRLSEATSRVRETAGAATQRAGEALDSARTRASDAYSSARERTSAAYDSARERASRASERTAEGIDSNPGAAIIGGLAIGALLAAVLPKTQRESEMLGDVGRKINDTAKEAARAATEAGRSKLDEAGLNRDTAKQKLGDIAASAGEAARTSASAAAQAVKGSQGQ